MFNEITKNAIEKAFEKPTAVNLHLVDAQQARRVLDRLVGYKISPLLWDKVRRGFSAGRVQTVALRLIVDRKRDRAFQKGILDHRCEPGGQEAAAVDRALAKKNDDNVEIPDEASAQAIVQTLDGATYIVRSVTNKEKRRNPVPPFITSTLQQEGVAQAALQREAHHDAGAEAVRRHRTGRRRRGRFDHLHAYGFDARFKRRAGRSARNDRERYGASIGPAAPNVYKSKKEAQDAHEAIRPTSALRTPESVEKFLEEDEFKLYRLIWMRFVASQMTPAVFDQTSIDIEAQGKDGATYLFRATGSVQKFDGFLKVYEEGKDQKDEDDEELKNKLPLVAEGEKLKFKSSRPSSISRNRRRALTKRRW